MRNTNQDVLQQDVENINNATGEAQLEEAIDKFEQDMGEGQSEDQSEEGEDDDSSEDQDKTEEEAFL